MAEAQKKKKGKKGKGKDKDKSAKWIPLELQRLFSRLQLLDTRTDSTDVRFFFPFLRQPKLVGWQVCIRFLFFFSLTMLFFCFKWRTRS